MTTQKKKRGPPGKSSHRSKSNKKTRTTRSDAIAPSILSINSSHPSHPFVQSTHLFVQSSHPVPQITTTASSLSEMGFKTHRDLKNFRLREARKKKKDELVADLLERVDESKRENVGLKQEVEEKDKRIEKLGYHVMAEVAERLERQQAENQNLAHQTLVQHQQLQQLQAKLVMERQKMLQMRTELEKKTKKLKESQEKTRRLQRTQKSEEKKRRTIEETGSAKKVKQVVGERQKRRRKAQIGRIRDSLACSKGKSKMMLSKRTVIRLQWLCLPCSLTAVIRPKRIRTTEHSIAPTATRAARIVLSPTTRFWRRSDY